MIITVASFKGGVGKTTTAIHIAAFIAKRRGAGRVVLGDGDLNRSALIPNLKIGATDQSSCPHPQSLFQGRVVSYKERILHPAPPAPQFWGESA